MAIFSHHSSGKASSSSNENLRCNTQPTGLTWVLAIGSDMSLRVPTGPSPSPLPLAAPHYVTKHLIICSLLFAAPPDAPNHDERQSLRVAPPLSMVNRITCCELRCCLGGKGKGKRCTKAKQRMTIKEERSHSVELLLTPHPHTSSRYRPESKSASTYLRASSVDLPDPSDTTHAKASLT